MRKFISVAATIVFVLGVFSSQAQYSFRVLANKGQNQVKKKGADAAVALKTGSTLNAGDEIIASNGAYIGLMHKSGKTLEVRTPGTKSVEELETLVSTKASSVTSRYASFLADKMNEKESPNYRSRLNATGAVSRALGGDESIQVLVPGDAENTKFIGDKVIISWDSPEGMEENAFIVVVKNIYSQEIMKEEVNKNFIELDLTTENMKNDEGLYIITVIARENQEVTSADIGIEKLKGEDAESYQTALDAIKSELAEDSPLNKIIYAGFYEENGLVIDALTKLQEAINDNPEIEDFEVLKKDLIERNGIKLYETQ